MLHKHSLYRQRQEKMLIILLQFNIETILLGLVSVPLIALYPYMKRYTHWPQIMLGIVFNWGILLVSIEFYNNINGLIKDSRSLVNYIKDNPTKYLRAYFEAKKK